MLSSASRSVSRDSNSRVLTLASSSSQYPGCVTNSHVPSGIARSRELSVAASRVPVATTPSNPSVVANPAVCTLFIHAGCSRRSSVTSVRLTQGPPCVARRLHAGSNGFRIARIPRCFAAFKTGPSTAANIWTCLCVSMCVSVSPSACRSSICALASASISAGRTCPASSRRRNAPSVAWKRPVFWSMSEGICSAGSTGSPSTSTTWQPTPSDGARRAISIASPVAAAHAIRVALVTASAWCNSRIARLTPVVSPKSSALTIRRPTG